MYYLKGSGLLIVHSIVLCSSLYIKGNLLRFLLFKESITLHTNENVQHVRVNTKSNYLQKS